MFQISIVEHLSFEHFTAVMFQFEVFCVAKLCSSVGYQRLGGPCCLHIQVEDLNEDFQEEMGYFLLATASRPVLGTT